MAGRDEIKASWVRKPQVVLKMGLLGRPSGRSQVFQLVCRDMAVNRRRDSNWDLPAVSDLGGSGVTV